MKLAQNELNSSTWLNLKKHIGERIEKLRTELEKTTKTHDETLVVRGQIKALRLLLEIERGEGSNE